MPSGITNTINILFFGDIVGRGGRAAVCEAIPALRQRYQAHFIIANAENSAGGFGLTPKIAQQLFSAGVNCITTGNHVWKNNDIIHMLESDNRVLRPTNYPEGNPGKGHTVLKVDNLPPIGIINVMGRVNLSMLPCPFKATEAAIEEIQKETNIIFVDFHSETTSEKIALSWYVDGRASAVIGTHTHVQTADEGIMPNGTAHLCDAGMCGPFNSVIGMDKEIILKHFTLLRPFRFKVARGDYRVCGCVVSINPDNGKAMHIERFQEKILIRPSEEADE